MKIKPFKILGTILQTAAIPITALVAGPAAGALVAAGMGAAGLTKKAGKKLEEKTGARAHKILSPAVAVSVPAALAPWVAPEAMGQICDVVVRACEQPALIASLPGLVAILAHVLGGNVKKVVASADQP
jgi:hypothetical protein